MEQPKIVYFIPLADVDEILHVIDGSNIAFEQRTSNNKPKLSNILLLLETLKKLGIVNLKIICDRSLFYCIDDRKGYSRLIKKGIIVESPEGTPSDIFILQYAFQKKGYIISNDKYREFYSIFKKEWVESRRISFKIIDDMICFSRIIIKGGEKNGQKP